MSYELCVWSSVLATSMQQADELSDHFTEDWVIVHEDSAFDAFMAELNARWPYEDSSPWASLPYVNGCAVELSISSFQAGETCDFIRNTASKHGLIVYDPQAGEVQGPPAVQNAADRREILPSIRLDITDSASGVEMRLLDKEIPVIAETVPTRDEARARARSYAIEHNAQLYSVTDSATRPRLLPRRVRDMFDNKPSMSFDDIIDHMKKRARHDNS